MRFFSSSCSSLLLLTLTLFVVVISQAPHPVFGAGANDPVGEEVNQVNKFCQESISSLCTEPKDGNRSGFKMAGTVRTALKLFNGGKLPPWANTVLGLAESTCNIAVAVCQAESVAHPN